MDLSGIGRGKAGPAGIGGVLHNNGDVLLMFSKPIGVRDSNKAEVIVILEALQIFSTSIQDIIVGACNLANAIVWVPEDLVLASYSFILMRLRRCLHGGLCFFFMRSYRALAKQEVEISLPLVCFIM